MAAGVERSKVDGRIAIVRYVGRKVTGFHRWGGNKLNRALQILANQRALVARKEKQLIFFNRAADHTAELVALESVAPLSEKVVSI